MTRAGRPADVRAWLRRPLWWAAACLAAALLTTWPDYSVAAEAADLRSSGVPVRGHVRSTWDHGPHIPVAFTDPGTGKVVSTVVDEASTAPERIGPVDLVVHRDTPGRAVLDAPADHRTWRELALLWAVIVGGCLASAAMRRRRVARAEALVRSDGPAYRMTGWPRPGPVLRRRWRMVLYPLDPRPGTAAVCVVPLITPPPADGLRPVDVKGSPRVGGSVVMAEPDHGRVWWPAGRALLAGAGRTGEPAPSAAAARLPDRSAPVAGWVLLGAAAVMLVVALASSGSLPEDVVERSELVTATVVESMTDDEGPVRVRYRLGGDTRTTTVHLAGPQTEGDELRLRVDPGRPSRLWQPGADRPPGTTGRWWWFPLFLLSFPVGVVGLLALRRARPGPSPPPALR